YYGLQRNTSYVDLLDPYEFVSLQFELDSTRARQLYLSPQNKTLDDYREEQGIEWQRQLFRTSAMQNYNLSANGGNKDTKYSLSTSVLKQEGAIISSGFNRFQTRFSLNHNLRKNLKVNLIVNYNDQLMYGTP